MATRTRRNDPVHGFANASYNHGYGHVNIHVYELFGYSRGTLKISCQSGGNTSEGETYGWEHGISNDYSVIGINTLKQGYLLMRRVERLLEKERTDRGAPENFADYALRVLRAAGVRKVHINAGVNAGFYGDKKDLPTFDPLKQGDALYNELRAMELKIISMR